MASTYEIVYQENKQIKSKILNNKEFNTIKLPKNIISIKKKSFSFFEDRCIKDKEIKEKLYELSLMLNSKILIDDAFSILIKNEKKEKIKSFLKQLQHCFVNSLDIEEGLKKFKINPLIKSLFKITQQSGNSAQNIEFLSSIIKENIETKSEFIKTMIYPIILLTTFILSLVGIFNFVLPSFESIFKNSEFDLPFATKVLFGTKDFFENYFIFLVIFITIFSFSFYLLYKNNIKVKQTIDRFISLRLSLISKMYRLKVLYIYFVVLEILLKNKFEFLDSLSKTKVLLKNQYFFDRITQIENLLKSGKSVKFSFEASKLFDDVTLNLINTAEVTNSMPEVICEIKKIYKRRFDNSLKFFSLLIEPLFFIIIMALIMWIVFAIFVPLWSMSDMLKV